MLKDIAEAMLGRRPFDLVIRNVQIVNVFSASIVSGSIGIVNGHIAGVFGPEEALDSRRSIDGGNAYALPGFVDSHMHLESSMLTPDHFARVALSCGTTTVCADPHEIANVLGIVMMSGLPAGCPGDKTPVWITTSWPPETQDILDYQWNEVAIPKWKELVRMAADCGIRQIALENHGMQLVYNPETLFRLREAVGPMVGMNLDPSHLFWMGGDPIEAARVLGEQNALYHVHGKDSRPERRMSGPNGLLDTKPIDQFRTRSWNYVAVGCGHGAQWWKEFFSTVRMAGYDGDVSLEMEDLTMPMLEGHLTSLRVLKEALVL